MYDDYKMLGQISIPEERKEEFNRKVLQLLIRGGIRKTEEITLNGKCLTVVRKPQPGPDGIVEFNYSIFEKRKRETDTFNMMTGILSVKNEGYDEYYFIMILIMALQQAYSSSYCVLTYEKKPMLIHKVLQVIDTLLEENTEWFNDLDAWKMIELFHRSPDVEDLVPMDILNMIDYSKNRKKDIGQFYIAFLMSDVPVILTDAVACMNHESIWNGKLFQKSEYLYRVLVQHADDDKFEPWFVCLLQSGTDERRQIAQSGGDHGLIAGMSLQFPAQVMVSLYAKSRGDTFWTVWERLNIQVYTEYDDREWRDGNDEAGQTSQIQVPLYRFLNRDSEDEFLEMWNGRELILSDRLMKQLDDWRSQIEFVEVPSEMDMEQMISEILTDMEKEMGCRFADVEFVRDCLAHGDDMGYRKLVTVLHDFPYRGTEFFPEMTREQALKWVLPLARNRYDSVLMSACVSLVTNHDLRRRYLGV